MWVDLSERVNGHTSDEDGVMSNLTHNVGILLTLKP